MQCGGVNKTKCPVCATEVVMKGKYNECQCERCQSQVGQECPVCRTKFMPFAVEFFKKLKKGEGECPFESN